MSASVPIRGSSRRRRSGARDDAADGTALGAELLSVRDLTLSIGGKQILDGVSFDAPASQVTGLAGESGSGKTMTGLAVVGLQPATAEVGGSVRFDSEELIGLSDAELNPLRGDEIAMIFQDPVAALHPMLSIGSQLTDHLRYHRGVSKAAARARAVELLDRVRVPDPASALRRFPHQFSGGQLQRIAIAGALACEPRLLIADEPTTALDVTVQAGILRLIRSLCDETGIAVILVTHDLGVMSAVADTIAVMRAGKVVEHGPRADVIQRPQHPYTKALIDALPDHQEALIEAERAEPAAAEGHES